jgi:hypothetical protein
MKHFTIEEVTKFVFDQPDNKMVDFKVTNSHASCGCLMVQIGQANNLDFDSAHLDTLAKNNNVVATFEFGYHMYFDNSSEISRFTYAEIKKWFRYKHWGVVEEMGL